MILKHIPDQIFEIAGAVIGSCASVLILLQIIAELQTRNASTLSPLYVLGFLLVYIFWLLYGLKFKRPGMWVANGIASVLQLILLIIIFTK